MPPEYDTPQGLAQLNDNVALPLVSPALVVLATGKENRYDRYYYKVELVELA
ncbi:MAG: hypothetical protein ACI94O_001106 [Octadecabacter sp.]|jgi:hypothetical protein